LESSTVIVWWTIGEVSQNIDRTLDEEEEEESNLHAHKNTHGGGGNATRKDATRKERGKEK
jgi:hypothetical protein